MSEQLLTIEKDKKMSRRTFFKRSLAASALIGSALTLNEGIRLNAPPIKPYLLSIGKEEEKILHSAELTIDEDQQGIVTILSNGKLFYEPSKDSSEEFFTHGRECSYIHRANSIDYIDAAFEKGADFYDIDINDKTNINGKLYGEHGKMPDIKFKLGWINVSFQLPLVVDQNEAELKVGKPDRYEVLVRHIAELKNKHGRHVAVSAELKRGDFLPSTILKIIEIHQRYGVPVMMYHVDSDSVDNLMILLQNSSSQEA